jgi:Skp family chaperone for outer membrane proteins
MKLFGKAATALLLAGAAMAYANTASAQVSGIATADIARAIINAKALGAAYQQIGTTFSGNAGLIQAKQKEMVALQKQLDTNKDNELNQAEMDAAAAAKSPAFVALGAKEEEINQLQAPAIRAQIYAIEMISAKYAAAQQQVITAKKISVILAPDAFLWAPPTVDITGDLTVAIDALVPSVATTPPANWQPSRSSVGLYQQINQMIDNQARLQAAQAAQQKAATPAATPGAVPKPAAPVPPKKPDGR